MHTFRTWGQNLLVAILLLTLSNHAFAQHGSSRHQTTEATHSQTTQNHRPPGDPMLGVLIIIGVLGFVILLAWIFSRVGEGNSRPSDNTLN